MLLRFANICRSSAGAVLVALAMSVTLPAAAQELERVDPSTVIDGDLSSPPETYQPAPTYPQSPAPVQQGPVTEAPSDRYAQPVLDLPPAPEQDWQADASAAVEGAPVEQPRTTTYGEDDLIGEAEGLFGKGAEGLAKLIEDILKKQGEPNGYIVGREGGGAFVLGVRYGSGTLHHKIEGNMPIYWTGPSIGIDAGANAGNTFVLVYNVFDTEQLYERFPAGEGQAYLVGGFNASYVRKGDIVLIPIRVGAGLRLGVNAGYMKFSKKQKWLPF